MNYRTDDICAWCGENEWASQGIILCYNCGHLQSDKRSIKIGDVVYVEGSSALHCDVVDVNEEGVMISWRRHDNIITCEQPEDLVLVKKGKRK